MCNVYSWGFSTPVFGGADITKRIHNKLLVFMLVFMAGREVLEFLCCRAPSGSCKRMDLSLHIVEVLCGEDALVLRELVLGLMLGLSHKSKVCIQPAGSCSAALQCTCSCWWSFFLSCPRECVAWLKERCSTSKTIRIPLPTFISYLLLSTKPGKCHVLTLSGLQHLLQMGRSISTNSVNSWYLHQRKATLVRDVGTMS